MPLILLPLICSAFVPVHVMPDWFQPIARYQPFTPPPLWTVCDGGAVGVVPSVTPHRVGWVRWAISTLS
jgi:hypothetical protein